VKQTTLVVIITLALLSGCRADEQKIAALEQRIAAAEARIRRMETTAMAVQEVSQQPQLVPPSAGNAASSTAATTPPAAVEVLRADFRAGESNNSWTRYSYLFTVRNTTGAPARINGDVLWLDGDGFTINSDSLSETVATGESTLTGESLIDASQVSRVASVRLKLK
jgi:uncharacterized protein YcfL